MNVIQISLKKCILFICSILIGHFTIQTGPQSISYSHTDNRPFFEQLTDQKNKKKSSGKNKLQEDSKITKKIAKTSANRSLSDKK